MLGMLFPAYCDVAPFRQLQNDLKSPEIRIITRKPGPFLATVGNDDGALVDWRLVMLITLGPGRKQSQPAETGENDYDHEQVGGYAANFT